MYAVVRHYSSSPGSVEEMVRQVDQEFADRVPERVGAILYSAIGTGAGTVTTITVFPDAETAARAEDPVEDVQRSLGERFGVRETEVHRGEVTVSRADPRIAETVRPVPRSQG
ncbi:hypothetical protein [Nonomuraea sp. NPDC023979]|uniref:hypothetical protein n=1 Tax=Nonomuraea sp. NPDC023979 TaxID=3154796 RepID=UPI00340559FA